MKRNYILLFGRDGASGSNKAPVLSPVHIRVYKGPINNRRLRCTERWHCGRRLGSPVLEPRDRADNAISHRTRKKKWRWAWGRNYDISEKAVGVLKQAEEDFCS